MLSEIKGRKPHYEMPKLTQKEIEEIMGFVKQQQVYLGVAMKKILHDTDKAGEFVVHTELVAEGEETYLVTTLVRPLTDEVKREIQGNDNKELQDKLPPSEELQDTKNTEGN